MSTPIHPLTLLVVSIATSVGIWTVSQFQCGRLLFRAAIHVLVLSTSCKAIKIAPFEYRSEAQPVWSKYSNANAQRVSSLHLSKEAA